LRSDRRRVRLRRAAEAALCLVLAAGLLAFWPQSLGGRVGFVMVSGHSMDPTLHAGDLVLVRARPSYRVGDVIAYRVPEGEPGAGSEVVHRIVGGDARRGFTTQGDHNDYHDPWHPRPADIVGGRWLCVPRIARWFAHLQGPLPLAMFAAVLGGLAAYDFQRLRSRRRPATQ
jgi:signal peptidase